MPDLIQYPWSLLRTGSQGEFWLATRYGFLRPVKPLQWLMVGAIIAGTGSVFIMPTMAVGRVPSSVTRMLEIESSVIVEKIIEAEKCIRPFFGFEI